MVLKLNLRMLSGLIGAFLLFNLFLLLSLISIYVWRLQTQTKDLLVAYTAEELIEDPRPAALIGFSERSVGRRQGEVWSLDNSILQLPSGVHSDTREQFFMPVAISELRWWEQIQGFSFELVLASENDPVVLSQSFNEELAWLAIFMGTFLVVEIVYISIRSHANTRTVRKILAPLSDLAEATWTLQQVSSGETPLSEDELNALAGELRGIDASSLDFDISIRSDQNELKSLTEAINGMLERIQQSYQSQVRFVSDASHELRTPIAVIQGYANLLDRWGKTNVEVRDEAIAAIKSETESMKQLIEQLLFLARGENHSLKLNPEPFDLAELAEDIVREAKLIDESHEYKFKVYSSAEVFADKQFIKQAVRVLIENAEKFSADGETISIRVRAWDQKASIEVQDNGIGIDAADVPRIFDRFYRSDESRARKTGGSGLGLAIAQWIATQHKAYYEVISQIDIGTRISLVLPQADASSIESN